ncbi:hypothetical protein Tco_0303922 [Tanacetum coccineum]
MTRRYKVVRSLRKQKHRKKKSGKKRAVKEQQQESPKRQKLEDDKETNEVEEVEEDDTAELKKHLVIKKYDDIAIDAIPLAIKPLEKKRAHFMIKDINKLLKERRMMRSLEKFVGDRLYRTKLILLQRSI